MKFLHAADLHLDSLSVGLKTFYGQEPLSISQAVQQAFRSLIDLALKEEVDFVVFAGDLFDVNWRDYSVGLFFIQEIKRLICPIYAIRGNHDSENRLIKELPYPENFYFLDSEKPQTILNHKLKLAIHGQSYYHYHIKEDLAANYPKAVDGYFNLGILHTSGPSQNGESPYSPYDTLALQQKSYDYWALGHIHHFKIVSTEPHIVYSGAIQGRQIKEDQSKGCCIVTVNSNKKIKVDFNCLAKTQWEKIQLNITDIKTEKELKVEFLTQVHKKIQNQIADAFVLRITFLGESSLEKSLALHEDYWRNIFYCWLQEINSFRFYIEKAIDLTSIPQSTENETILSPLYSFLNNESLSDDQIFKLEQMLIEEKQNIKGKIPIEYQHYEWTINSNSQQVDPNFISSVKSYIEKKIKESSIENS